MSKSQENSDGLDAGTLLCCGYLENGGIMRKIIVFCIVFFGLACSGYAADKDNTGTKPDYKAIVETILNDKSTDELTKINLLRGKEDVIEKELVQETINEHLSCVEDKNLGEKKCTPEMLWLYSEFLNLPEGYYSGEVEVDAPVFTNNPVRSCHFFEKLLPNAGRSDARRFVNIFNGTGYKFACLLPYLTQYYKMANDRSVLDLLNKLSPGWFKQDPDYQGILAAADEFAKIVGEKDLSKLLLTANLDKEQIKNIDKIFNNYSNIEFERDDISKWIWSMDESRVSLRFYKYENRDGTKVLLNPDKKFSGSIDLLDVMEYNDSIYLDLEKDPSTGKWGVDSYDLGFGEMSGLGRLIYSGIVVWFVFLLVIHLVPLIILIVVMIKNKLMAAWVKWILVVTGLLAPILSLIIYLIYNHSLEKGRNQGGSTLIRL